MAKSRVVRGLSVSARVSYPSVFVHLLFMIIGCLYMILWLVEDLCFVPGKSSRKISSYPAKTRTAVLLFRALHGSACVVA